jgi:kinesin family protein 2/24
MQTICVVQLFFFGSMNTPQRIKVVCRKRPLNRKEVATRQQDVVKCTDSAVIVREPRLKVDLTRFIDEHTFHFDDAYEEDVSNYELYKSCVYPLVSAFVCDSAKCTCFAYGQTGSGKTYALSPTF